VIRVCVEAVSSQAPASRTTRARAATLLALLPVLLAPLLAAAALEVDYASVVGDPPSGHGTNSYSTDQDEALLISRWQESGIQLIRIQLPQYFFEPMNDNADPGSIAWENFLFDTAIPIPPPISRAPSHSRTPSAP